MNLPYEEGETSGAQLEATGSQRSRAEAGLKPSVEHATKMGQRNGGTKRIRLNVSHLDLTSDLRQLDGLYTEIRSQDQDMMAREKKKETVRKDATKDVGIKAGKHKPGPNNKNSAAQPKRALVVMHPWSGGGGGAFEGLNMNSSTTAFTFNARSTFDGSKTSRPSDPQTQILQRKTTHNLEALQSL